MAREILTYSRMQSFKECRRRHNYGYEIGLRRIDDSRALRMGSAFHDGIDALTKPEPWVDDSDAHAAMAEVLAPGRLELACEAIAKHYANCPEQFDQYEWQIEHETIRRLVCAYDWRWKDSKLEYIAVELPFRIPLVNPETGKPTPNFDLGGKIDAIVKLEDGRIAVKETKTVGDDIGQDSDLWRKMRMDHQVSLYIHAARKLGYQVDTVLYDCVRKPTISATPVPLLDENGLKIVLDSTNTRVRNLTGKKDWRQTADKEKGYVLQVRPMTVQEWGDKLTEDIVSRPEFYFQRVEVPRMDQDVAEFQQEIWDIQQQLRQAQREKLWYRTVGRGCVFCPFFEICSTNQQIDVINPPIGFEVIRDLHPELSEAT